MEGNICLWHIQQLQPLVLDPKRPGREGGLSEAVHVQPRCHRNIYRLHNWMKLILLQLTCRTSRWYRQFRFVVPPQCWEHGSPPPLGQTQLLDNGSLRLVKLVGHTGGSHKELSVTPLVTHGGSYRWDTEVEHTQDGQWYCWSHSWVIQVGQPTNMAQTAYKFCSTRTNPPFSGRMCSWQLPWQRIQMN